MPHAPRSRHSHTPPHRCADDTARALTKPSSACALMTLRSGPSVPPRARPHASHSRQRGGQANTDTTTGSAQHGARDRPQRSAAQALAHPLSFIDGRSPRRGTLCHARTQNARRFDLGKGLSLTPHAQGRTQATERSLTGRLAAKIGLLLRWLRRGGSLRRWLHEGIPVHPVPERCIHHCRAVLVARPSATSQTSNTPHVRKSQADKKNTAPSRPASALAHHPTTRQRVTMPARLEMECFRQPVSTAGSRATGQGPPSEWYEIRAAQGLLRFARCRGRGRRGGVSAESCASGFRLVFQISRSSRSHIHHVPPRGNKAGRGARRVAQRMD
jgi:hypothetical protein